MKYVILIHSNPQPWGHPTGDFVAEQQALPQEQRDAGHAAFEGLLTELSEHGELVGGEALPPPPPPGSTAGTPDGRWSPTVRTRRPRSTSRASSSSTSRPRSAPRDRRPAVRARARRSSCAHRCPAAATTSSGAATTAELEDVWRRESPHVLAALLRRHGDYATARTPLRRRWRPPPSSGRARGCPTVRAAGWCGRLASPVDRADRTTRAPPGRSRRHRAAGRRLRRPTGGPRRRAPRRRAAAPAALLPSCAEPPLAGRLTLRSVSG